jgi:glycosyltransferase involved in cell wall biosynthesis
VRKVLYVSHTHMTIRAGGAQAYAGELCEAIQESGEFDALFVSRSGPPQSSDARHAATRLALADEDTSLYYFHTERSEFDVLLWSAHDKRMYTHDWRAFLEATKPDIVHFHHAMFLGYDMIRETRRTLPDAAIVFTLHEFMPICYHRGQMVRTESMELCHAASPRRCHECFPSIPAATFFLRNRFIQSAFDLVDGFISPSAHARRRYIEWGIPPDKIIHEDYGRFPVAALPDPPEAGRRKRIGFFGQITPYKGVDVLLEAMKVLQEEGSDARLTVWGVNLELQSQDIQERVGRLLEETAASVRFAGSYEQSELPGLMASVDWVVVPSIWWETGPLVIHEARQHRRPVICSDIGSMLERVQDGVNGLLFHVRDPDSLADTIRRAVGSPELWDQLRSQITEPHSMAEHLAVIIPFYRDLLAVRERSAAA